MSRETLIKVLQGLEEKFSGPSFFHLSQKTEDYLNNWFQGDKTHLVLVLKGRLSYKKEKECYVESGHFVLCRKLPISSLNGLRLHDDFSAVIIRFECDDWQFFEKTDRNQLVYKYGKITSVLNHCIAQFIEWEPQVPTEVGHYRRSEILHLLLRIKEIKCDFTESVKQLITKNLENIGSIESLSQRFYMSKSTFVRRLRNAGTSLQILKDQVRMEKAYALLKNSDLPLYLIANKCGYRNQSKFGQRFKLHYHQTPSQFRRTQK